MENDIKPIQHEREACKGLDSILLSIIENDALWLNLDNISVAELLTKLQSDDFNKLATYFILGLALSKLFEETKVVNFEVLTDKLRSSPQIRKDKKEDVLQEDKEVFIKRFKITEEDKVLLTKILEGVPLKLFEDETGICQSTANKKIRRLWGKLGLESREQLIFTAGWMRIISPELECLNSDEAL